MQRSPIISLSGLIGEERARAIALSASYNGLLPFRKAERLVNKKISLYPRAAQYADVKRLSALGSAVSPALIEGDMRPAFFGSNVCVGYDGVLRLVTGADAVSSPLGHAFSGYGLINEAKRLGLTNAVSGALSERLAEKLVSLSYGNGAKAFSFETEDAALISAVRAMRGRFDGENSDILVLGEGRGALPFEYSPFSGENEPIFDGAAGFIYRASPLKQSEDDIKRLGALLSACKERSIPTLIDERESFLRCDGAFLCKKCGVYPDMILVGRSVSGGEYSASELIASGELSADIKGYSVRGELTALSSLVTLEFALANAALIKENGEHLVSLLNKLALGSGGMISEVFGGGLCARLVFSSPDEAIDIAKRLDDAFWGVKADTGALELSLPLITDKAAIDAVMPRLFAALGQNLSEL